MLSCTQCKQKTNTEPSAGEPSAAAATDEGAENNADPMTFLTPSIPDDGTDGYQTGDGLYIYHNMALELCYASDSAAEDYAAAISAFKKSAPDVTVYNMVVPTHVEFALPERLCDELYLSSQSQNLGKIFSSYTEDVKPINAYNALCEHRDEYIYFNTDHHWTALGAYYAYQAFCEQTGQEALSLNDCTEKKIEGFTGTFFDADASLEPDNVSYWLFPYQTHAMRQAEYGDEMVETTVIDETYGSGSASYYTFIGGDSSLFIEYNDDNKNGKKIAVVKDSFGCAFVPYLTNNYEEVHVIDPRYYQGNLKEYLEENGITEVMFFNNIMSANNPFHVESDLLSIIQ